VLVIVNPNHRHHAPAIEFYRGAAVACVETPARAQHVEEALRLGGHELRVADVDSASVLARIHSADYLEFLEQAWAQWLAIDPGNALVQPFPSIWPVRGFRTDPVPANFVARLGRHSFDNGTPMVAGTWAAAKTAADAAASAARLVLNGQRGVFCCTRPPGHHAARDLMGGYCFLNHAAVAAQSLLDGGAARVAILDVDYHHGNGTQSIFYERADALFVSLHGDPRTEYPFFLGYADECGQGPGLGFNLNLPLPAGTTSVDWFRTLQVAVDRVAEHRPDAVVVSLGLDTFEGDPISRFKLATADFRVLGSRLAQLGLPTVFVLEGGYAASELGLNALQVVEGFEQA